MKSYRVVISYVSERDAFVARAPELRTQAEGSSRSEALAALEEEMTAQLELMAEQGVEPPVAVDDMELDGRIDVEVTPDTHRELLLLAKLNNVDLSELVRETLARESGRRWSPQRPAGGRGRGGRDRGREGGQGRRGREGQGSRYHDIMENRADFIDYVRRLDSGGRGKGGGGGRQGGGRGR